MANCRSEDALWMIALWNKPLACGIVIMIATFETPPDWLKMVTLLGSLPKTAMLSRTYSSA